MATTWTTNKRFRHWHKFLITFGVGGILLLFSQLTKNTYLHWGAGITFVVSCWFAIMSVLELLEKVTNN